MVYTQTIPQSNFEFKKPVYYQPKEGVIESGKKIGFGDVEAVPRPLLEHEIPLTQEQVNSVNWTKLMTSLIFTKCLQYAAGTGLAAATVTSATCYLKTRNFFM
jgi:hypothetical protein